jgi:hypothetical protein
MPFSAIYDACVLYPFETRDVLMVAARTRAFALYWTDAILEECTRNLIADGLATFDNMSRMTNDMNRLYPEATIALTDYESLIPVMTNHAGDRHVLAAAVAKGVDVIVTNNIKHFPDIALDPYDIEAQTPDKFVRHVLDLAPEPFIFWFKKRIDQRQQWALNHGKKPHTAEELAKKLANLNKPLSETSVYLLECLANPRYKMLNIN